MILVVTTLNLNPFAMLNRKKLNHRNKMENVNINLAVDSPRGSSFYPLFPGRIGI